MSDASTDMDSIATAMKDGTFVLIRLYTKAGRKLATLAAAEWTRRINAEAELKIERDKRRKESDELRSLCDQLTKRIQALEVGGCVECGGDARLRIQRLIDRVKELESRNA